MLTKVPQSLMVLFRSDKSVSIRSKVERQERDDLGVLMHNVRLSSSCSNCTERTLLTFHGSIVPIRWETTGPGAFALPSEPAHVPPARAF
jgi:hypothetical protein